MTHNVLYKKDRYRICSYHLYDKNPYRIRSHLPEPKGA